MAAEKVPPRHGIDTTDPSGQYAPASHGSASYVPAAGQSWPSGHLPPHMEVVWKSLSFEPSCPAAHAYGKSPSAGTFGSVKS